MLELARALDPAPHARTLASEGVVQIRDVFTTETAEAMHQLLAKGLSWDLILSDAEGGAEVIDQETARRLGPQAAEKAAEARKRGATGFAYLYVGYPLIQALMTGRDPGHPIHHVTAFLNSEPFLELGRRLTGAPTINKSDIQATLYRPGDFLNVHDDRNQGERVAAFTIGLTKGWRPDWGGQLLFHDEEGDVIRGFAPRFNALNVFTVPRSHSVAAVALHAAAPRYSIIGWWRND